MTANNGSFQSACITTTWYGVNGSSVSSVTLSDSINHMMLLIESSNALDRGPKATQIQGSYILVIRPKTDIPETMICRMLVLMWSFGRLREPRPKTCSVAFAGWYFSC